MPDVPECRFFKTKDRKTFKGKIAKKNATSIELKIEGQQKNLTLPVGRLTEEDQKYVMIGVLREKYFSDNVEVSQFKIF